METNIRKPHLPPGTKWMLRNMENSGCPNSGKWLEVVGWGIEWGVGPTHSCPIFHCDNIRDDFHWSLYSRFTSRKAEESLTACALVEVEHDANYHFRSTGRVRNHRNLPECTHFLCRDERNAWSRRNRKPSETKLQARALELLSRLSAAGWFRTAAPEGSPEVADLDAILRDVEAATARKEKRTKRARQIRKWR